MRLSEAIILGSLKKPQGFEGTGSPSSPVTCALGAARDGAETTKWVDEVWPWVKTMAGECPECQLHFRKLGYGAPYAIIVHLNNGHKWTRPRIAEWVATIEPSEPEEAGVADNINLSTVGLTPLTVEQQVETVTVSTL